MVQIGVGALMNGDFIGVRCRGWLKGESRGGGLKVGGRGACRDGLRRRGGEVRRFRMRRDGDGGGGRFGGRRSRSSRGALPDVARRNGVRGFVCCRLDGALISGNVLRVDFGRAPAVEETGKEAGTNVERRLAVLRIRVGNLLRGWFFQLALGKALFLEFCAPLAPVAPAVVQRGEIEPAGLEALEDGLEADGRGKPQSRGGQHAGHQPCALDVQIGHQQAGHQPAHNALDRQRMKPQPAPGQQPEDGGQKGERQNGAHPAQPRQPAGARTHPGPAQPAQPQGQEEGGDANGLQQQVAEGCAEEADPIADGMGAGRARGGIQRRVRGMVRGQRKQDEQRGQHHHQPQEDVEGAAARWR